MPNLRRTVKLSQHPAARIARRLYWGVHRFTLPAPRPIVRPMLWAFLAVRAAYYFALRVMVCEPLFKAYCKSYGRGVRAGVFVHWVQGKGDIVLGDHVVVDGKCAFTFASAFSDRPTLTVGDHTGIGHGCSFTVAKRIEIGRHCRIATNVAFFDSSGHPADPVARLAGQAPAAAEVRPITVGDNVWIAGNVIVNPGVTIGEGSVVSAGAVVTSDVPPNTLVAGNPARKILTLRARPTEPVGPSRDGTGAPAAYRTPPGTSLGE